MLKFLCPLEMDLLAFIKVASERHKLDFYLLLEQT